MANIQAFYYNSNNSYIPAFQKNSININTISNNPTNLLSFNGSKPSNNYNYVSTTPSPSYNRRNIINLNDNKTLRQSLNSPVIYHKLKEYNSINISPQINNHHILRNVSPFPLNKAINNNSSFSIFQYSYNNLDNQTILLQNHKKRKIIINHHYLKRHSFDSIKHNINNPLQIFNNLKANAHNKSNSNIINNNTLYIQNNTQPLKAQNNIALQNNPNINQNQYNNYINNSNNNFNYNYQQNINIKIFNELNKHNQNNQQKLNLKPFNDKNNINIQKYNQNIKYNNSIDITKSNDFSQSQKSDCKDIKEINDQFFNNNNNSNNNNSNNNNSNNNNSNNNSNNNNNNDIDINKKDENIQKPNYINSIDLNKTNDNTNYYSNRNSNNIKNENSKSQKSIDLSIINKNANQRLKNSLNNNFSKKNPSTIYFNTMDNILPDIQQNHANIIPIPKKIMHFNSFEKGNMILSPKKIETNLVPNDNFQLSEFTIINQIGVGGFGKIYSVRWKKNNELYALKQLSLNKNELNIIKAKVNNFKDLAEKTGHNGFTKIYGDKCIQQKNPDEYLYYIIMELGERDWIKELKRREDYFLYYSEYELFQITSQLVKTLALMQKNHLTHRDIKPHNILISKGIFKLCDFDESQLLIGNGKIWQHIRGSELYMSPIIYYALSRKEPKVLHNTYKSDVFSLGMCILLAASFSRKLLCDIREIKDMNIISNIINNALSNRYSEKIINLIIKMLQIDESLRCDFIELERYISSIIPY